MANYDINYEDQRFTEVEQQKQEALTDAENTYGGMINESDKYYQAQIDASKQWAEQQQQNQQAQTDFAIEKIEQQKEQANKDYTREQSGAYVDWQKQSNQYGANAEQMASAGLTNSGYSESSQVSMYNTYQNRVATARESYNQAILNYNNSIKDAQLQNSSILAEIAYNALQQQLELSLQGFQYKNQLVLELTNKKQQINDTYYNRYQDVLDQINKENALAEQIRQYNEDKALKEQQMAQSQAQWEKEYAMKQEQFNKEYALQQQKLEEDKRQYNESLALQKSQLSKSSGGSSGGSSKSSSNSKSSKSSSKKTTTSKKATTTKKSGNTKTVKNAKTTGVKLGAIFSKQELKEYGLSSSDTILSANGTYYVKKNGNYVELTHLKPVISTAMKLRNKVVKSESY